MFSYPRLGLMTKVLVASGGIKPSSICPIPRHSSLDREITEFHRDIEKMLRLVLVVTVVGCLVGGRSAHSPAGDKSHPVRLSDIQRYVQEMDRTDGFKTEFSSLPSPTTQLRPWTYANTSQNIPKHRYPTPEDNLLTYDDTRVVLYRLPGSSYLILSHLISRPITTHQLSTSQTLPQPIRTEVHCVHHR